MSPLAKVSLSYIIANILSIDLSASHMLVPVRVGPARFPGPWAELGIGYRLW